MSPIFLNQIFFPNIFLDSIGRDFSPLDTIKPRHVLLQLASYFVLAYPAPQYTSWLDFCEPDLNLIEPAGQICHTKADLIVQTLFAECRSCVVVSSNWVEPKCCTLTEGHQTVLNHMFVSPNVNTHFDSPNSPLTLHTSVSEPAVYPNPSRKQPEHGETTRRICLNLAIEDGLDHQHPMICKPGSFDRAPLILSKLCGVLLSMSQGSPCLGLARFLNTGFRSITWYLTQTLVVLSEPVTYFMCTLSTSPCAMLYGSLVNPVLHNHGVDSVSVVYSYLSDVLLAYSMHMLPMSLLVLVDSYAHIVVPSAMLLRRVLHGYHDGKLMLYIRSNMCVECDEADLEDAGIHLFDALLSTLYVDHSSFSNHCNPLESQRGPGFSSNNAGDGPWEVLQMHRVLPLLPKYNAKEFIDFKLMLSNSVPLPLSMLLNDKVPTPTQAASAVVMTADQRREYKEGYDMHNRCLYQSLIHCCSADVEARAILMSPIYAKETKGLEAWKALVHKHTDVSNVAKLATIHKLLSLKQREDETPELYMIREQTLFQLVQSQNINFVDLRQSLFLSGLKPKYKQLIDTLLLSSTTITIPSIVDVCNESDLRNANLSHDHTRENVKANSAKGKGRESGGDGAVSGGGSVKGGDTDLMRTLTRMQKQLDALAPTYSKVKHGSQKKNNFSDTDTDTQPLDDTLYCISCISLWARS